MRGVECFDQAVHGEDAVEQQGHKHREPAENGDWDAKRKEARAAPGDQREELDRIQENQLAKYRQISLQSLRPDKS